MAGIDDHWSPPLPPKLVAWLATAIVAVSLAVYALSYPLNHDVGWWLYVMDAVLAGDELYSSILEINPPLPGFVLLPPLLVQSLTGWPLEPVLEFYVLTVVFIAMGSVAWLLEAASQSKLAAPVIVGLLVVAFLGLPGIDFGQREHLMFVLTGPYLGLLSQRLNGREPDRALSLIIGLTAAIGFCLKPHFALIWFGIEAWYVFRARHRSPNQAKLIRPESLCVGIGGVTYILIIVVFFSEYLGLLWQSKELYEAFNPSNRLHLMTGPHSTILLIASVAAVWRPTRLGELARLWIAFGWFALAIAVIQGKGWSYHLYPILAAAMVATGLLMWDVVRSRLASGFANRVLQPLALLLLTVAVVSLTANTVVTHVVEAEKRKAVLARGIALFEAIPEGASLLLLSDRLEDGFPLVNATELGWVSPFAHLWWIKALYAHSGTTGLTVNGPKAMSTIERDYWSALVDRAVESSPDFIAVDTLKKSFYSNESFPYIEYLSADTRFRQMWQQYARHARLGRFVVWQRSRLP